MRVRGTACMYIIYILILPDTGLGPYNRALEVQRSLRTWVAVYGLLKQ